MDPHTVIRRPLLTEKGWDARERDNAYMFSVHPSANKIQIRRAVEEIFGVKVLKVRTQNRLGKLKRVRFRWGQTPATKRAIVTLHPDDSIDLM